MCLACLGPVAIWSQGEWPEQVRVGREMGKSAFPVCTLQSPAAPPPSDTLLAVSLQETGCSPPIVSSRARNYLGQLTESLPPGERQSVLLWGPRQRSLVLGSKRKPGFLSAGSPAPQSPPPACPGKMGLLRKTGALAESTRRSLPLCAACGHDGVPGLNLHQQWCKSNLYHLK